MKRLLIVGLSVCLFSACTLKSPVIGYEAVKSENSIFVDSLFGVIDSTRQLIDVQGTVCMLLDTIVDFNGDGVKDVLMTDVQACGGNAIGNAFFFATYTRDGRFVRSNSFGTNVYEEPVIEPWEGMKSVVIIEEVFDEWTEEFNSHRERYVLVDTCAMRAEDPSAVIPMPVISLKEWQKEEELEDMGEETEMSPADSAKYAGCSIYDDLYSGRCSWYCGGEVQDITASSSPKDFEADNAHDFNHLTVWTPSGNGIGESLVYTFRGACPRITTVKVLNGDVQSEELWIQKGRVKLMRMYVNDKPYALLSFEDSRSQQCFDVGTIGYHDAEAPDWTITFEILETYPGTLGGVAIAELNFDGIDVH